MLGCLEVFVMETLVGQEDAVMLSEPLCAVIGSAAAPGPGHPVIEPVNGLLRQLPCAEPVAGAVYPPLLISRAELAALMGISLAHLTRRKNKGLLLGALKLGGRLVRYSREEVVAWIGAGCVPRDEWERMKKLKATSLRTGRA